MSLPKIVTPTYTVTLPSNGKSVRIRPFLVKEEKLLLIAVQTKDTNEIINATKQVVNNCLVDNDVNVDSLPFFDVDYLITALRAKSISETVPIRFTCNNIVEESTCGNVFSIDIDISKATILKDDSISSEIWLSGDTGVRMKYPKYSVVKTIMENETDLDKLIRIICASIDSIFDKKEVYSTKDMSKEEVQEFVEGLTKTQFAKLENFVANFPEFECKLTHTCEKCKYEHNIRYNNFDSFFL
jgi:T4 bacteriophage base plate protein